MPNEDILTALKNAVNKGESLQQAMQIMISSGYDSREVQEASKFVEQGITPNLEQRPDEQLIMSNNQGVFTKMSKPQQISPHLKSLTQGIQTQPTQQTYQKISEIQPKISISQTTNQKIEPAPKKPRKSYFKEIILVIILLILVGVLITTIFLKDKILGFFS